ncbi:MAG: DUF1592 domain-containing protein [Verrucomicrobiales bacterium]
MPLFSDFPSLLAFSARSSSLAALVWAISVGFLTGKPVDPAAAEAVLAKYCYDCHGGKKTKGDINLKALAGNPQVGAHFDLWESVSEALEYEDMPPEDDPQPTAEEKELLMAWLGSALQESADANAGDPGQVTVRRLTNTEYDRTVRGLTGVDFGFGRDFLPDGGGGEGFSNVGDVLFVSPQQLDKYLNAARTMTEHARILPGRGIEFRKERVGLRGPEQFKSEAEQALYVWYQKMATPYLPKDGEDRREDEYMIAAWRLKHKDLTGVSSLAEVAREMKLSEPFLENWVAFLNRNQPGSRFLDLIRKPWQALPGPDPKKPRELPAEVKRRILRIEADHLAWNKRSGEGWVRTQRRQQDTDGLRRREIAVTIPAGEPIHLVAGDLGDGNEGDWVMFDYVRVERGKQKEDYVKWLRRKLEGNRERLKNLQKEGEKARGEIAELQKWNAEGERVLALFGKHPRGEEMSGHALALKAPQVLRLPWNGEKVKVRAGARMDMGDPEAPKASHQWTIAGKAVPDPKRIIPGALIIYQRRGERNGPIMGAFNQMKRIFPDEFNRLLQEVSRNYLRKNGDGEGVYYLSDKQLGEILPAAEKQRLERMKIDWHLLAPKNPDEKRRAETQQRVLGHLWHFASRAWRRPLTEEEKGALRGIYEEAVAQGANHETAGREVLMRVLIAPDFLFKLEDSQKGGVHPVGPWELATRLSYFLWAAPPDAELRRHAADGSLLQPEVLAGQAKRMLRAPQAAILAEEFAGQWLKFHGFFAHGTVDGGKFPEFTPELRADMHRETREFFAHLVREDRPVSEVILADYTFLNERLARHYGVPGVTGGEFRKVAVGDFHRGGILGMGSVLTKTSFPQRTSPVLRGDWLLHVILGQPTPPPPADVPELEEAGGETLTLREKLEKHRDHKACASCHDKIDPLGFSLESFDSIGRWREVDETGRQIDASGALKDGTKLDGLSGLRAYLATREKDFARLFSRKLLAYALGREILASDQLLLEEMTGRLSSGEGRFSEAVELIVRSPQFRNRRDD